MAYHIIIRYMEFYIGKSYKESHIGTCYMRFDIAMLINNPRELGALIRQVRIRAGLSQTQLATALGTYQPEISKLEKGNPGVRLSLIFQAAKTLGLNLFVESGEHAPETTSATSQEDLDELDAIANTGLKK